MQSNAHGRRMKDDIRKLLATVLFFKGLSDEELDQLDGFLARVAGWL